MFLRYAASLLTLLLWSCASTSYYDANSKALPGLPFVYRDPATGQNKLGYVQTRTGFGTASFTVKMSDSAGYYTEFTNNLDSTATAELAGGVIDKIAAMAEQNAVLRSEMRELRRGMAQMVEKLSVSDEEKKKLLKALDVKGEEARDK